MKKVSGKGNAAPFNGVNGDLIVLIAIEDHEKLIRDGNNLHFDHYISFADAALGINSEIPTVTGKVKIKLEEGIQIELKTNARVISCTVSQGKCFFLAF